MPAALTLEHPTPFQVWRLGRAGWPCEIVSRHATQAEAEAAAAPLRGARAVCDVRRPLDGWLVRWSDRHRVADGQVVVRRPWARQLADVETLRGAPAGAELRAIGLTTRRAYRAARALSCGILGTQERPGPPVEPCPDEVQIVLHRGRLVVARDGQVADDPAAEARRLVVAIATLRDWGGTAQRRELRRLLGWSPARLEEVADEAVEVRDWVRLGPRGVLVLTRAGRRVVERSTERVAVAAVGGARG